MPEPVQRAGTPSRSPGGFARAHPPAPTNGLGPQASQVLRLPAIVLTAFLTTLIVLVVLNASLGNKQVDSPLRHTFAVGDGEFERTMAGALTNPLVSGNDVTTLVNGEEIFPAMLNAVRSARHSTTLETYIYWSGNIGQDFAAALAERASAGVAVHVMLDWIGGRIDNSRLEQMRAKGVHIRRYNPPRWYSLHRLNNRTHRKLMVVDGQVGFIGGVGIADAWKGDAGSPSEWRDTHYRVQGPVVTQLQSAFTDNWLQTAGEVLQGDLYFPPVQSAGAMKSQVFTSSPGGGSESMQLMTLLSLTAARRTIDIATPYYLPDEVAIQTLVQALRRGVRVRILMPGPHIDFPLIRRVSRASWGPLLHAGAQLYEYQPTMLHWKLVVVDGAWTSVGSANFDDRSFAINDEANMNVLAPQFAQRQLQVFEQDLLNSHLVSADEWNARPDSDKLLDWLASALRAQL
jgi:cardiolipin synthase